MGERKTPAEVMADLEIIKANNGCFDLRCADKRTENCECGKDAYAILAALTEAGWAVVPAEPTEAMLEAAADRYVNLSRTDEPTYEPGVIYRVMLGAAARLDGGKEGE